MSVDLNSNIERFIKSDHASYLFTKFSSYLQQGYLCDVVFIFNNDQVKKRIVAHRLIVSSLSDSFRELFENCKENEITLNHIDPDVFEKVILYAYEGKLFFMVYFDFEFKINISYQAK